MTMRHRKDLLSKKNSDLIYFANLRFAANMDALMDAGNQFFNKELANGIVLMTPSELNKLLDEARRGSRYNDQ